MNFRLFGFILFSFLSIAYSSPSPKLPGQELPESQIIRKKSKGLVEHKVQKSKKTTWLAPPITEQLSRDGILIGMGKGAIFVPTFTEGRLEPELKISGIKTNKTGRAGQRIILDPGEYDVFLGSGSEKERMRFRTTVKEGQTTLINPEWGGLTVETLDPDGNYIRTSYEIYRLRDAHSYGKGYGLEEARLQEMETWILPPGKYRITGNGAGFAALRNFITVQVNPGELSALELIFDPETDDLIAGGLRSSSQKESSNSPWHVGLRFGGTTNFENRIINSKVQSASLNVLTNLLFRLRFESNAYTGLEEILMRNSFSRERNSPLSAISDDLQFRSLWIRRLNDWIGPYIRAKVQTHLFSQYRSPEKEGDTLYTGKTNDSLTLYGERLRIKPPGFPLEFGEGLGVNLELANTYIFSLSMQGGIAARQKIIRNTLISTDLNQQRWTHDQSSHEFGAEGAMTARLRIGSALTLDLRSEVFLPNFDREAYLVDELAAELRLQLTHNIEVSYLYQLFDNQKESKILLNDLGARFENTNSFLLQISLNF